MQVHSHCNTVEDSMQWAASAAHRLSGQGIVQPTFGDGELLVSTTCSGIETPPTACRIATKAMNPDVRVRCLWACDKDRMCLEENLAAAPPCAPETLFEDVTSFLQHDVKRELFKIPKEKFQQRRDLIMQHDTKTEAWCIRKGALQPIRRADIHIFGSPCVHDSSFGKRKGIKANTLGWKL